MNTLVRDIKSALSNMGQGVWDAVKAVAVNGAIVLCIVTVIVSIVVCGINWPLTTFLVFLALALAGWFYIELETARVIREHEEKQQPPLG